METHAGGQDTGYLALPVNKRIGWSGKVVHGSPGDVFPKIAGGQWISLPYNASLSRQAK